MPTHAARAALQSGQADGYIADKKLPLHFFCVYLPHADGSFVKAHPAGTTETVHDGPVAALGFSGDNSLAGEVQLC
ncbi:MAG: hypothetical protein ACREC0_15615 [Methylocella sp.]